MTKAESIATPATSTPKVAAVKKAAAPRVATKPAVKQAAPARKAAVKRPVTAKKVAPAPSKAVPVAAKPKAVVAVAKPVSPAAVASDSKLAKEKKPKMVRDSVTIPKAEYAVLEAMKHRAAQLKVTVKKTELIRAGMKHLATLPDAVFLAAIAAVPSLKTGRPSKG